MKSQYVLREPLSCAVVLSLQAYKRVSAPEVARSCAYLEKRFCEWLQEAGEHHQPEDYFERWGPGLAIAVLCGIRIRDPGPGKRSFHWVQYEEWLRYAALECIENNEGVLDVAA